MKKKGLSGIVAALIMVLLVLIMIGAVWAIVNNIIKEQSDYSCFGNYDKVTLNNQYTCYEFDEDTSQYSTIFSINVGDIDIDGIVVDLISEKDSESFTLKNNPQTISGLKNYGEAFEGDVKMPDKNAGLTYNATNTGKIDSIRISPIIGEEQCAVADTINEIDNCLSIVS